MNHLKKLLLGLLIISGVSYSSFAINETDHLCMYIRAKTPKVSIPRIIDSTKEIVDDQYFDAEISILGAAIGHPNYEDFSPEENIALFVFREIDKNPETVALVNFKKNSLLKKKLLSRGNYIKDIDNWSFITSKKEVFNKISNPKFLIQITEKNLKSDIEICPILPRLSENLNIDTLNQVFLIKDEKMLENLRFILDTIRDEIDNLTQLTISANFNKKNTSFKINVKAKPGSDIGELFSASAGGITKIPQCIFKSSPIVSSFSHVNVNNYKTFLSTIWHKLLKNSDFTNIDIKIQKSTDDFNDLCKRFNGQAAFYLFANSDNANTSNTLLILSGSFNDSHAKRICVELLPDINADWKYSLNEPLKYKKQNIFSVNHTSNVLYTCACQNNLIISDSINIINETIDNIFENHSKISLDKGCAVVSKFDLKAMLSTLDKSLLPPDFSTMVINPIEYRVILKKNQYEGILEIDNTSFKNALKALSYVDDQFFVQSGEHMDHQLFDESDEETNNEYND